MSRVSDKEMNAGLRQRKKPETIAAEVRETIVSQMHADAMRLPLDKIVPSPYQVRHITKQALEDLMDSIKDTGGLISPIVVRPSAGGYELIAGHTRYLACVQLKHPDIPAVVRPMSDAEAARALAADNLTRKDLTDFEICKQIETLMSAGFLNSNSEASRLLGRTRQDVIRYRSFTELPAKVLELLAQYPDLFGGSAAKALLDFLPDNASTVIEACQRLAAKRTQNSSASIPSQEDVIQNQTSMLAWIRQQLRGKMERREQHVLDKSGTTVGTISWSDNTLKLTSKMVDLEPIEAAIKRALEEQGYRL